MSPVNDLAPIYTDRVYSTAASGNYENRELPFSAGDVVHNDGKDYRFVQNKDALAIAAGDVVCFTTDDNFKTVSADRAGGASVNTRPAGVALAAIVQNSYGWIQATGLSKQAITTDGGVSSGEELIPHATADGEVDSANYAAAADPSTSPTSVLGVALEDDTSTTLAAGEVDLSCPTTAQPDQIA